MFDGWLKGGLERLSHFPTFSQPCWSWGVFELWILSLIQDPSQPSTDSRDMNFSISLLTLEKLLLTSFLNPTLQISALLEALPHGGQWGECVPPSPCFHFPSTPRREVWGGSPFAALHSSFLPPRERSDFLWLVRLGKGLLTTLPQSSLASGSRPGVKAPTHLLEDGLSQDRSQGKKFRNPTMS